MYYKDLPRKATEVVIEGLEKPALVHKDGMIITGTDGQMVGILIICHINLSFI